MNAGSMDVVLGYSWVIALLVVLLADAACLTWC